MKSSYHFYKASIALMSVGFLLAGACTPVPAKDTPAAVATATLTAAASATTTSAAASSLQVTSSAFSANGPIPQTYTCDGSGAIPALSWTGQPSNTQTFALVMDDPDARSGTFVHWVLFNISSTVRGIPEGMKDLAQLGERATQGKNSAGRIGYAGPCPPKGPAHHYRFHLYALDATLNIQEGASAQQVRDGVKGHVLAESELVGIYQRAGS